MQLTLLLLQSILLLANSINGQQDIVFPLKISIDISRLSSIKTNYSNGNAMYDKLAKVLIPATTKHIEETYESYDYSQMKLSTSPCNGMSMGSFGGVILDSNLHIIFNYESSPTAQYVAYAGVCKVAPNSRPLAGFVYINLAYTNLLDEVKNEDNFSTLLHEVHHILGFQSSYLPYFWDRTTLGYRPENQVYEKTQTYTRLIRPEVVSWVNGHFGCNENLGVPLENSGSDGSATSHFDMLVFGNEMLNPASYYNTQFSGATIAYIESMGFFKVRSPRTKMEEVLVWGAKQGCGPLRDNPVCSSIPMTCKYTGRVCSDDYFSYGQCSTNHANTNNKFAGNCSIFREEKDCRYANKLGSRCIDFFSGTQKSAACGDKMCTKRAGNGEIYDVVLTLNGNNISCSAEETGTQKLIVGTTQSIICPNTYNLCRAGANCPNDCSNFGRCRIDGTCWCFPGATGEQCTQSKNAEDPIQPDESSASTNSTIIPNKTVLIFTSLISVGLAFAMIF